MKPLLVVITGPTAVGKTSLSVKLADHYNCPVVSADSRQAYKEMRIGTAVPSKAELQGIPHYFIHSHSIHDDFNAGIYEEDCIKLLDDLFKSNNIVFLCGGSGLYINAVLFGQDELPPANEKIRTQLNKQYKETGIKELQKQLKTLDPVYYAEVDLQNPQRLMRAIEVCESTGKPYSELRKAKPKPRNFKHLLIGIDEERETLYQRINNRVENMIDKGLIEEAKNLYSFRHLPAVQTVGYTELFKYFNNQCTLEEAIDKIKQHSRNYAKRQLTWIRKNENMHWFKRTEIEQIIKLVDENLKKT